MSSSDNDLEFLCRMWLVFILVMGFRACYKVKDIGESEESPKVVIENLDIPAGTTVIYYSDDYKESPVVIEKTEPLTEDQVSKYRNTRLKTNTLYDDWVIQSGNPRELSRDEFLRLYKEVKIKEYRYSIWKMITKRRDLSREEFELLREQQQLRFKPGETE